MPFWAEPSCIGKFREYPSLPHPQFQSLLNYNNTYKIIVMGNSRRRKILGNSLPFIEFIPPNARSKSCPAAFFFFCKLASIFQSINNVHVVRVSYSMQMCFPHVYNSNISYISFLGGLFELREGDLNPNSSLKVSNYFINNI